MRVGFCARRRRGLWTMDMTAWVVVLFVMAALAHGTIVFEENWDSGVINPEHWIVGEDDPGPIPDPDTHRGVFTRLVDLGTFPGGTPGDHALYMRNEEFAGDRVDMTFIRSVVGYPRGFDLRVTFKMWGDPGICPFGECYPRAGGPAGPWHGTNNPEVRIRDDIEAGLRGWASFEMRFEENGAADGFQGPLIDDPDNEGPRLCADTNPDCIHEALAAAYDPADSHNLAASKRRAITIRCWVGDREGGFLEFSTDNGATWVPLRDDAGKIIDTRVSHGGKAASGQRPGTANPVYLGLGAFKHAVFDDIVVEKSETQRPATGPPHEPAQAPVSPPPAGAIIDHRIISDFEAETFGDWDVSGAAFGPGPARSALPDQDYVWGFLHDGFANSHHGGTEATGVLTSPGFTIEKDYVNFLIAGDYLPGDRSKRHPKEFWGDECCVTLLVDAQAGAIKHHNRLAVDDRMVLRWTTGPGLDAGDKVQLEWATWDVSNLRGRKAWLRIVDNNSGPNGFICVDQIHQSDQPAQDLLSNDDDLARADAWVASAARHVQRKGFHFKPPVFGMSGFCMVHHKDYYHLFYIHYPHAKGTGGRGDAQPREYWKHARSKDLVYWEDQPMVIWPSLDSGEFSCISGAVTISDEGVPMIFYPSSSSELGGKGPEQWVAVGDEDLVGWRKHAKNPMTAPMPENPMPGGVDPFVFKERGKWYMGIGGYIPGEKPKGVMSLFESDDLVDWKFVSNPVTYGSKSFEEPDLFKLDGKWVAVFEPYGPSQYLTGDFDLDTYQFTPEHHDFLDYAGVADYDPESHTMKNFTGHFVVCMSVLDQRDRRICLGLAPSGISLPRILSLRPDGRLAQRPIPELAKLRREHYGSPEFDLRDESRRIREIGGDLIEIKVEFEPGTAAEFGLKVRCSQDGSRFVRVACDGEYLEVQGDKTPAELMEGEQTLRLHVFIDQNIMEVFANDWVVYTESMSGPTTDLGIEVFSDGGATTIKSLDIWKLDSIW